MRTLHFGLRVADLDRSLAFYTAVGYEVVGSVPETPLGHLTMLKLPADEFVTIELVHDPAHGEVDVGTGLSHFVIQVESMDAIHQCAGSVRHRRRPAVITGWLRRLSNDMGRRSRRQPRRVGPVAGRARRRHDCGGLGGVRAHTPDVVRKRFDRLRDACRSPSEYTLGLAMASILVYRMPDRLSRSG